VSRWLALLGCFGLSGFAALLYQTAWTRAFGAVFGTSELAVATVLAAYMGGLAAGAAAAARLLPRVRRPVLVYGLLELGIAILALAVPLAIRAASALEVRVLGGSELAAAGGLASALFYLACAFAILGLPTALMGATLPLLAKHAVRREAELGRKVGVLYAVNTAGAIAGTLVAGFVLLPALGLHRTVLIGVAANAAVFALAAALARLEPRSADAPGDRRPQRASEEPARPGLSDARARWILPLACASGAISFAYEVLWTRLLGFVLGGSVYAFSTMLASVLLGISIGGALAARAARDRAAAMRAFAAAELATALLAWAAFRALEWVPDLAARLHAGGGAGLAANAAIALLVLVPPSLAIGATFPLAVRALARDAADAGPASARVYAWNTVGAIAGSVGTGFALLPLLAFAGALRAAFAGNLLLAAAAALLAAPPARRLLAAVAVAAAAAALAPPREPWRLLRASPLGARPASGEMAYTGIGRAATVVVLREGGELHLRSNGLPEATVSRRGGRPFPEAIVAWLGGLPALLRPEAKRLLVVGLGGGAAIEDLPASFAAVDVVELEPEVVSANRAIAAERRVDPLADPRVRVRIHDARSALLLSSADWDAIASQPSHPWGAGASHLYTREFFELVRGRLAPDGVFVQWMGLAFVDAELLRSLLATLLEVFPHVLVYRPAPMGVLFAASPAPLAPELAVPRALAGPAAPQLARRGIVRPEDAAAALVLDAAGARALAAGAAISTDDENRLATHSPRALSRALAVAGADALFAGHDPLVPPPPELDPVYLVRRLEAGGSAARAERVAASVADPARRDAALAALALARNALGRARSSAERALARDPGLEAASAILVLAARAHPGEAERAARSPAERAVATAWALEDRSDFRALRALEPELARVGAPSPLEPEAARLRARWRLAEGGAAQLREGLSILDEILARFPSRPRLELRAELAAAAGDVDAALASLAELVDRRGPEEERRRIAARATALLQAASASALSASERAAWSARWTALATP
jgi:spermidine synthase